MKAENCKGCSLYAKGECKEYHCLEFRRLKRAEYIKQHPAIDRKELLNYLRSLVRFNETDFDLGYNEAISTIIDKVEEMNTNDVNISKKEKEKI